eukprot:NODE_755_length_2383_cov_18.867699_g646_i0.p1 GENE.NODE_755_length_2383_cov_18.867699_g646_i0~~NODE_755_length_2383_cov_18.867699_g646_i0.p1  ORF type:complete len:712 (+),score=136.02 NODE_755_length_2383_cov_18.867699_g646_i0:207-2138(+)
MLESWCRQVEDRCKTLNQIRNNYPSMSLDIESRGERIRFPPMDDTIEMEIEDVMVDVNEWQGRKKVILTQYTICIIPEDGSDSSDDELYMSLPIGIIREVDKGEVESLFKRVGVDQSIVHSNALTITLECRDFRRVRMIFPPSILSSNYVEEFEIGLQWHIHGLLETPLANILGDCIKSKKLSCYFDWNSSFDMEIEMTRQKAIEDNTGWTISFVNNEYKLCSTYPKQLCVPKTLTQDILLQCAQFRSKERIPALTYYNYRKGTSLCRCSQPLVGIRGQSSTSDEAVIKAIKEISPNKELVIIDARSYMAASGNQFSGKGTENPDRYQCKVLFSYIPNIHVMRQSADQLHNLVCTSIPEAQWLSALESTHWLDHISSLISSAKLIVRYLEDRNTSVLVHCSDGWDRTTQLVSLVQIMVDPYYRTPNGFYTLLEKDWMSFGHKFRQRLGHPDYPEERSPVFLQFLDCVWQIYRQMPQHLEFTEKFLLELALHSQSGLFGNMLMDSEYSRNSKFLGAHTPSLWTYLSTIPTNPSYLNQIAPIRPNSQVKYLTLWSNLYLRYGGTDSEEIKSNRNGLVMWVPDEWATVCQDCRLSFSLLRRKHHCRCCGRIFCASCAKTELPLPQLGYTEKVRVCESCRKRVCSGI